MPKQVQCHHDWFNSIMSNSSSWTMIRHHHVWFVIMNDDSSSSGMIRHHDDWWCGREVAKVANTHEDSTWRGEEVRCLRRLCIMTLIFISSLSHHHSMIIFSWMYDRGGHKRLEGAQNSHFPGSKCSTLKYLFPWGGIKPGYEMCFLNFYTLVCTRGAQNSHFHGSGPP